MLVICPFIFIQICWKYKSTLKNWDQQKIIHVEIAQNDGAKAKDTESIKDSFWSLSDQFKGAHGELKLHFVLDIGSELLMIRPST